jgi:uncharacterized membrane protein
MSRWLLLILVLAVLLLGGSLAVWVNRAAFLPEQVPVHWGASGQPDQMVPRDEVFWYLMITPLVMLGFVGLAVILPWLSPAKFKVDSFRSTYNYIMGLIGLLFFYIGVILLAAQTGVTPPASLPRILVGGMMVVFLLLGNVLGKVKRNFWMGVRTPWTLASDVVWERTHRVAAWLFSGGALVGLVLVLSGIGCEYNPIIAIVPFFIAAIVPVFYSLWLYKRLEKQGRLGNDGETRSA